MRNEVLREGLMIWDNNELHRSAFVIHIAIADYLHFRTAVEVPASWEYSPSPIATDIEEDCYLSHVMHQFEVSEVLHAGNILHRYRMYLRSKGLDDY